MTATHPNGLRASLRGGKVEACCECAESSQSGKQEANSPVDSVFHGKDSFRADAALSARNFTGLWGIIARCLLSRSRKVISARCVKVYRESIKDYVPFRASVFGNKAINARSVLFTVSESGKYSSTSEER